MQEYKNYINRQIFKAQQKKERRIKTIKEEKTEFSESS